MSDMKDFPFNEQQLNAMTLAVEWFHRWQSGDHSQPTFFLAGYAGTGKTTVALTIAEKCVGKDRLYAVEFIAPTGKAASRLRQKGCKMARTMHQFAYNMRGEDEDGELIFTAKEGLDNKPKLIVLDECSMVGEWDLKNLLKHGVPILALGDIGQLPPVNAAQVFHSENVDVLLDKIERNDGNIVRAAFYVRQGNKLPPREYDDVKVRLGRAPLDELVAHAGEDAQVLCAFNSTRTGTNARIRKELGFSGELPQIGEKVVCRFNQHGFGIMNGEQGIVIGYKLIEMDRHEDKEFVYDRNEDEDNGQRIVLKSLSSGKTLECRFEPRSFSSDPDTFKEYAKKPGAFDYGYVLTVHSSQGSEWEKVLVIEETLRGIPYNRLMYTAVTRAQLHLMLYRA